MTTHICTIPNFNFKKCSCRGLNENCFKCDGKGWIDEENGWIDEENGWIDEENGWIDEENGWIDEENGWIDEGNDVKIFNISSKFENNEDICWEIEIYIQRKEYNLARKLLNENKNKLIDSLYEKLVIKCNEKESKK